jgi:hypothetical protein
LSYGKTIHKQAGWADTQGEDDWPTWFGQGTKDRAGQFFATCTLEEVAEARGVGPLNDPEEMAGAWPEGQHVDDFLKETYEGRG